MLTFLSSIYNNIKNWLLGLTALATGVLSVLFIYEKNKVAVDDALIKESKLNQELISQDSQIATNNQSLEQEAQKRDAIQKEPENAPTNSNIVDLFNSRK